MDLLERERELAELTAALARAGDRRGSVVTITGEPGMGKSAVVAAFTAQATAAGARVLVGACDDLVTPRVLGPLRDAARGAGPLARALAEGASEAVDDALLAELDNPLAPTVLVVEDAHWADEATVDVIGFVGRRIDRLPAVVVLTYRDADVRTGHPLRRMLGRLPADTTHHVTLGPLSVAAIATLCDCPVEEAARIQLATAGNPFFVHEVARWGTEDPPPTVRDMVLARLQDLPTAEQHALGVLATFPTPVDRSLLAALADGVALDEAERQGLVVVDPLRVGFVHDLARRAVATALPVTALLAQHEAAARVLQDRGADPVRVLHHAVAAGLADLVAEHGLVAADRASRAGSHREALAHLEHVVALADALPAEVLAGALERLARELQLADRHRDAVESAARAVAVRERLGEVEPLAAALLAESRARYWYRGQAAARPSIERATSLLEDRPATPTLALCFAHRARLDLLADRMDDAGRWASRAVAAATRPTTEHAPTVLAEVGARVTLAAVALHRGDEAGADALRTLARRARDLGHHETVLRAEVLLATGLLRQERLDEASACLEDGIADTSDRAVEYGRVRLEAVLAVVDLEAGRLTAAARRLDELDRVTLPEHRPALSQAARALVAVRGGAGDASRLAEDAWDLARDTDEVWQVGAAALARVEVAWHARDVAAAEVAAGPAIALAEARGHDWLVGQLSVALARAGTTVAGRDDVPEGFRHSLAGDHLAAAAWFDAHGSAHHAAVERTRSGDRAAMLDGLAALDAMRAVGTANVARAWLREAGVASVPRGPTRRTRRNPAGLTARQVDVLHLLADGLTNAEIASRLVLSVRTVDHHVSAILTKLGVASRTEAVARLPELEADR